MAEKIDGWLSDKLEDSEMKEWDVFFEGLVDKALESINSYEVDEEFPANRGSLMLVGDVLKILCEQNWRPTDYRTDSEFLLKKLLAVTIERDDLIEQMNITKH